MLRCVGLLVVLVSGQDQDEASLLQTLRKQNHEPEHDPDHAHEHGHKHGHEHGLEHVHHHHDHDHHGNNYDNIICPFLKLLTRYNCIPDPQNFNIVDFKAAMHNFGDDGGMFNATARIFFSPFAPLMTDITKWDGTPIEANPVTSLGLADPVSQKEKFKDLVSGLSKEQTKQIGVREFAALLVKQSVDELVNQSDIKSNTPVAGPFAAPALFHLFGTTTNEAGEKTMSKKEFEGLFERGEIPKPIRDKYSSGEGCPTFPAGSWPSGNLLKPPPFEKLSVTAAKGVEVWPTDLSGNWKGCQITTFPDLDCD